MARDVMPRIVRGYAAERVVRIELKCAILNGWECNSTAFNHEHIEHTNKLYLATVDHPKKAIERACNALT
jgi:hypothetical protein